MMPMVFPSGARTSGKTPGRRGQTTMGRSGDNRAAREGPSMNARRSAVWMDAVIIASALCGLFLRLRSSSTARILKALQTR